MHQFEQSIDHPVDLVKKILTFLVPLSEDGQFIFSFYNIPVIHWAKISQLDFPCEIIVDLQDEFSDQPKPKELEGLYVSNDKLILSYPFEFEQVLRSSVEVEDVAVVIDGSLTDTKRLAQAMTLLSVIEQDLSKLSDYTFTFWVDSFVPSHRPPAGKGGTISIDLDGVTPMLLIEFDDDHTHLAELTSIHPLKQEFEKRTGLSLVVSRHARALLHRSQAEQGKI